IMAMRVLVTPRAPQSLMAWLLGLVFAPWVAIPLYALLGGRKFPRGAKGKHAPLRVSDGRVELPGSHPAADVPRVLRTEGVPGVRAGNAFRLLGTGEEAYAGLLEAIQSAQRTIDLTIFILGNDEVGRSVVAALAARARAGVRGPAAARRRGLPPHPFHGRARAGWSRRRGSLLHAAHPRPGARTEQSAQPPEDRRLRRPARLPRGDEHRAGVHGPYPAAGSLA